MILITGGAGYIGSHCALKLLGQGAEVTIFDNLSTGHIETISTLKNYGKVNFIEGDLKNFSDLESLFSTNKIDAVIHFAALSKVEESVVDPEKYYTNNVVGTLNLLGSMLKYNVKKIVFSSTAATYGEPLYTPVDETHPQNPINPYGRTKLMMENIMDDYDKAYGLKSVRLRYFNVVGVDSKTRIGGWHIPETHLVPNILKSSFNKAGKAFELFGDDYNTKDGTCVRDYINVEDLIEAHLLALKYLEDHKLTAVFNLGTNTGYTVKEVFAECEKVVQKSIPIVIKPRRAGDPANLVANSSKAKNTLKWTNTKDLNYSIKTTYAWEQKLNQTTGNN